VIETRGSLRQAPLPSAVPQVCPSRATPALIYAPPPPPVVVVKHPPLDGSGIPVSVLARVLKLAPVLALMLVLVLPRSPTPLRRWLNRKRVSESGACRGGRAGRPQPPAPAPLTLTTVLSRLSVPTVLPKVLSMLPVPPLSGCGA
jgi:hypothetical protein